MSIGHLRAGELVAGAGALALLVVLFLDWSDGESGWAVLGWAGDALVALAIALALWLVGATASASKVSRAVAASVLTTLAAAAAVVVVALRVADDPLWPAWLGLAAAVLLAIGAWRAMADERTGAPESEYLPPPPRPAPPA